MVKSASEFRSTHQLVLPSGKTVEVRRPNLIRIIMANAHTGAVPTPLVNQALAQFNKDIVTDVWRPTKEEMSTVTEFMDLIVRSTLAWPVIADNPNYDAGEIAITDLDGVDYQFIVAWAMPQEQAALSSFREKSGSDVETVQSVNGVVYATKPLVRDT
jgi:hypothetical protein